MTLRERAEGLGINVDDASYQNGSTFCSGDKWCGWCHRHATRNRRLLCDCQQAEAGIIRNGGSEANPCSRCHEPTAKPGSLCGDCRAADEAVDFRRYRWRPSSAYYVDDGHGCVERVHPTELKILNPQPEPEGFR